MSYTNKTQHYDLPQWVGTDKPTWLGDMNTAFATIDGKIYTATSVANSAYSSSQTANNNIASLTNLVNTNTEQLDTLISDWVFTSSLIIETGSNGVYKSLRLAVNENKSLMKVYGQYDFTLSEISGESLSIPFPAGVISNNYQLFSAGSFYVYNDTAHKDIVTAGNFGVTYTPTALIIPMSTGSAIRPATGQITRLQFLPYIIVNKDLDSHLNMDNFNYEFI